MAVAAGVFFRTRQADSRSYRKEPSRNGWNEMGKVSQGTLAFPNTKSYSKVTA